jgi:hypothetical protein
MMGGWGDGIVDGGVMEDWGCWAVGRWGVGVLGRVLPDKYMIS